MSEPTAGELLEAIRAMRAEFSGEQAGDLLAAVGEIADALTTRTEGDADGPGADVNVVDALLEIASAIRYVGSVLERLPR